MANALSGKRAFVTGATGFLGGTLALRLAREGAQVRALARSPEKGDFLRENPNIEILQGDVTDPDKMREATKDCHYVFHVAATTGDLTSQQKVNVEGTRHVMEASAASGVERVIHVSTVSVYGYPSSDVSESAPLVTGNCEPYALTKAQGENVVREVGQARNLSHSIIRPAMIYGPRSALWTETMFNVARRKPTIWIGNGSGTAYPIYVDDVVDMMVLLATHPAAHNEAFNCAPDPSPTWREFLGAYSRLAGHQRWLGIPTSPVIALAKMVSLFAPRNSTMKDAPKAMQLLQRRITYKTDKARKLLNWQPNVDLETGIANCAPWLREKGLLN